MKKDLENCCKSFEDILELLNQESHTFISNNTSDILKVKTICKERIKDIKEVLKK